MAQKKQESEDIRSTLKQIVSSAVISQVKEGIKNIVLKAQEVVYQTERKIIESLFASIILLCGIVFVVISLALMISDYLKVSSQWGFFIMGLVLIIIALIFKERINKTKYYKPG